MKQGAEDQSGYGLFQMLVVVGVASLGLLGMFQMAHTIQISSKVQSTERLLTTIANEARSYKKLHGSYAALNCDTSDPECYFVRHRLISPSQKSSFNGEIFINNDGDENLTISMQNIPKDACPDLVMTMNHGRPPKSIELFNPDQEAVTDNADATDLPPCGPAQQIQVQATYSIPTANRFTSDLPAMEAVAPVII